MIHGFDDSDKTKVDLLNYFYPVGTVYETSNADFNPGTVWGGTWVKIEGRMLIGANSTYRNGTTGGAASVSYRPAGSVEGHTLTVAEIPSHTHNYVKATGVQNHTLTLAEIPSHKHDVSATSGGYYGSSSGSAIRYMTLADGLNGAGHIDVTISETAKGGGGGHSHGLSTSTVASNPTGGGGSHNHSFTGTQATINTMPPYRAVYIWERTA